jgi:dTDP-4-dehydrorhamnose reductase
VVRVVDDEFLTPTPTYEIARKSIEIVKADTPGLYHLTCEGECSWYQFACAIFEDLNLKASVEAVSSATQPSSVRRPVYSVLENARAKQLGVGAMPHWRESISMFLHDGNPWK